MKHTICYALILLVLGSCGSAPPAPEVGSLDRNHDALLSSGKSRTVDIVTFNDFHATLAEDPVGVFPEGKNPGIAKFAEALVELKQARPNTVIVAAGDNYQGSALSILTKGKVVNEVFRRLGVAASAVGNHEFDWGNDLFPQWTADGGFPFLAANLVEKATGKTPDWAQPYALVRVGGHLVAFIGLSTLDTLSSTKGEYLDGYRFLSPADAAQKWVTYLQSTYKPELIFALTHVPSAENRLDRGQAVAGSSTRELDKLSQVQGLDAIITGHSHLSVNAKASGVPVIQAYYNGRSLGRITVTFAENGTTKLTTGIDEIYKAKADLVEDPATREIVTRYTAEFGAPLREKVATLSGALTHENVINVSPMGRWVTDVLRERFHVQVALQNGGGLRKGFAEGPLVVQDFWDLMPFDNTAVTFKVTGAVLKDMIDHGIDSTDFVPGQFSGLVVTYNPEGAYGAKILSMKLVDGTPVVADRLYSVVTNDFVFEGGDKYRMIKPSAVEVVNTFVPIRDVLIEAARKAGSLRAPVVDGLVAGKK